MNNAAGFALRDVVFGTAAITALAAITIPALSQMRMDSSRQMCAANSKFIASTSASYINDNAGKMWALSWKTGMLNPYVTPTRLFGTDAEAQAYQAVGIFRRLGGFTTSQAPVPSNWYPQILNAHAALLDYINLPLPASFMVCPEDRTRLEFHEGDYRQLPFTSGDGSSSTWPWIVSSSYKWDVFQWSPSRTYQAPNYQGQTQWAAMPFPDSSGTGGWIVDGSTSIPNVWGPRLASDIRYPSQKVFLSDDYARHSGQTRYYADQNAAQDLLFHDGSVRYYKTSSTNPGWDPRSRFNRGTMTRRFPFSKQADAFGTLGNGAQSANYTAGWYRWTRGGHFGWDVPRMPSMVGKLPSSTVIENEVNTASSTGAW